MSNRVYDILKYIALIVLPAIATLYGALAGIWGLPYGQEIVSTIAAIDCFLGALIGISGARYNAKNPRTEVYTSGYVSVSPDEISQGLKDVTQETTTSEGK